MTLTRALEHQAQDVALRRPYVLLVSGAVPMRTAAADLLAIFGYNVIQVSCGWGAVQTISRLEGIGVVIVDSRVRENGCPDERPCGLPLVERIKQERPQVQVLYWCADEGCQLAALQAGARDILIKGDDPCLMPEAVQAALNVYRQGGDHQR